MTNGFREIASPHELTPFELFHAASDPNSRVIAANVSFVACGVGGVDPERSVVVGGGKGGCMYDYLM